MRDHQPISSSPKLFFCFPYRGVGGVSLLFLRIAEELAIRGNAEVHLVDYADGFMALNRRNKSVRLIEYRDSGELSIPNDAVAVFQSMTPWSIFPGLRLSRGTHLLFWNCHPFNLVPVLPGLRAQMQGNFRLAQLLLATILRSYRKKMSGLAQMLNDAGALVFMDQVNVRTTERHLGLKIPEPRYLPIPAPASKRRREPTGREFRRTGLRLAWIGRVVDFKYHILKYALSSLERLQPQLGFPIDVKIVGSGDLEQQLKRHIVPFERIAVRFISHIEPQMLDAFLVEDVDVLMAMGTSALEGAKLAIPTLLLDMAYSDVPDGYLFRWLHEQEGYCLGAVLGPQHILPGNDSLFQRLNDVVDNYDLISRRAVDYFSEFHSLETVAGELCRFAGESRCTYGQLLDSGMLKRGTAYSAFVMLRQKILPSVSLQHR